MKRLVPPHHYLNKPLVESRFRGPIYLRNRNDGARMAIVFLSSTYKELIAYRQAAFEAIQLFGHQCVRMEDFPAEDRAIEDFCADKVRSCEVFVLILGKLYGTPIPGTNRSYTEDEFDVALQARLPILVFVPEGLSPADLQDPRMNAFWQKARRGRLPGTYKDEQDLKIKVGVSLAKYSPTSKPPKYAGEMLAKLCDRTAQLDRFGESFETGTAGVPEIYVVSGHELEQHAHCIERLVCYYITYPKRGSPKPLLYPPADRAIVEWPAADEEDDESILLNRLCRRLNQALQPGSVVPATNPAQAYAKLAIESQTPYVRVRHVMRAEDWTPGVESLCTNRYLKFWVDVKERFATLPAGVTAPRVLIFFEFKHGYTAEADIKAFRSKLSAALVKHPAGNGLIRQMLPELPSVQRTDLEVWYEKFEYLLPKQYQGQPYDKVFPPAPLRMTDAELRLRQLLGGDAHAD